MGAFRRPQLPPRRHLATPGMIWQLVAAEVGPRLGVRGKLGQTRLESRRHCTIDQKESQAGAR